MSRGLDLEPRGKHIIKHVKPHQHLLTALEAAHRAAQPKFNAAEPQNHAHCRRLRASTWHDAAECRLRLGGVGRPTRVQPEPRGEGHVEHGARSVARVEERAPALPRASAVAHLDLVANPKRSLLAGELHRHVPVGSPLPVVDGATRPLWHTNRRATARGG